MGFEPQRSGAACRIDSSRLPPGRFVAAAVNFAMVTSTQGNRELVADLPAKGAALRKSQVMRIRRTSPTDEARLFGDEPEMLPVANATRLLKRECALVDRLGAGRAFCFGGWACQGTGRIATCRVMLREARQLRLKCVFHAPGIGRRQTVLGAEFVVSPRRRIVGRSDGLEFSKHLLAQRRRGARLQHGLEKD